MYIKEKTKWKPLHERLMEERLNETGKIIHKIMERKFEFVEFRKESMTPTPGLLQGGFLVKEYKL